MPYQNDELLESASRTGSQARMRSSTATPSSSSSTDTWTWQPQVSCSLAVRPNLSCITSYLVPGVASGFAGCGEVESCSPRSYAYRCLVGEGTTPRDVHGEVVHVIVGTGTGLYLFLLDLARDAVVGTLTEGLLPERHGLPRVRIDQEEFLLHPERPHEVAPSTRAGTTPAPRAVERVDDDIGNS
nr:hypothetical protein [Arthrobacter sp. B1805]